MNAKYILAIVGLLLIMQQAQAADPTADRNAALINSFQIFCTLTPPNFDIIDQKSSALRLPVHQDIGHPQTSGNFVRSKSWVVTLNSGPHDLLAAEANGPKGHIQSCGISALDVKGDDFMKELVDEMHLDPSPTQTMSADGIMRISSWSNAFGEGSVIQLVDATPKKQPGIMLFYRVTTSPMP